MHYSITSPGTVLNQTPSSTRNSPSQQSASVIPYPQHTPPLPHNHFLPTQC
ncbi:hypothetical protein BGY98DRAFT_998551, partial [Russula aff. rugulosa BPL654]